MVGKAQRLIFIFSLYCIGCSPKCAEKYNLLEIWTFGDKEKLSKVTDKQIICAFEKNVQTGKKLKLLKKPNNFDYLVKCSSNIGTDIIFIRGDTISINGEMSKCQENYVKILNLEVD